MPDDRGATALPDYLLHGVRLRFDAADARIAARLRRQWAPFAAGQEQDAGAASIHVRLAAAQESPPAPALPPVSAGPVAVYYRQGAELVVHLPRWGQFTVDLAANTVAGVMTEACLETYGVFEDMIMIALAPLLRRQGLYTLHAFAAAVDGRGVALAGDIGAGKTTTGIGLLCAGARLIANDSPLLRFAVDGVELCAYPGLISAYPASLAWFPALADVLAQADGAQAEARQITQKLSFAAEEVWPAPWQMAAAPGLLLFPQVTPGAGASTLQPLGRMAALQRLVGQSIENWDEATIPDHLRAVRLLVEQAPAFDLLLAPDVDRLPALIAAALR